MLTGVTTLILAAATAALPFTPPPGWVQLPPSAVSAHANAWQGPKPAHGESPTLSAVVFPFPGTLDMMTTSAHALSKNLKTTPRVLTQLSSAAIKLCGTPARFITNRVHAAGTTSFVEQEVAVKNGYAYMLIYTRPSGATADTGVVHAMRAFCPSGTSSAPVLALPSAWSKSAGDMQLAGMWMGTRPGEMMMLMSGSPMSSLDRLLSSSAKYSMKDKSLKNPVKVTQRESVSLCGYPGMLVDMAVAGPMPMSMRMSLTQGSGKAYVLMYTEFGSSPPDPAAVSALQTLCVTGASPEPSAPSASPSPTPTP